MHDAIGQEPIGGDVYSEWSKMLYGQRDNIREIIAHKGLATREPYRVELTDLLEYPLDVGQFKITFTFHFPGITHDTPCVATKRDGIG
jgi:hypothetical protein